MASRFTIKVPKWKTVTTPIINDLAKVATTTMDDVTTGLKTELRNQVTAAGMGAQLANTWRGRRYPVVATSLAAAAFVYSKAPEIIDAFDRAPVIRTVNGARYLAIPTANVPRSAAAPGVRGSTHRMTPMEVETYFNQDLKFARSGNGRLVAYIDAVGNFLPTVLGKPKPSYSRASVRQLSRYYRGGQAPKHHVKVAMFVLTPTARMPKRFHVDAAAQHWAGEVSSILERRLGALS